VHIACPTLSAIERLLLVFANHVIGEEFNVETSEWRFLTFWFGTSEKISFYEISLEFEARFKI
jgi:hypothetical protein